MIIIRIKIVRDANRQERGRIRSIKGRREDLEQEKRKNTIRGKSKVIIDGKGGMRV